MAFWEEIKAMDKAELLLWIGFIVFSIITLIATWHLFSYLNTIKYLGGFK